MKVLVTGASGFVGRSLCAGLVAKGHVVVAVTRTADATLANVDNVVVGDISAMRDWRAMSSCQAVVHLAAHVHRLDSGPRDRQLFRDVNVGATTRLVEEAGRRGVARFVFTSSVKVHGESSGSRPFVETSPIAPCDDYARTKAEAEAIVRNAPVPSVVLRPPLVYGPGVGANFLALLRAVARKRPLPLALVCNERSMLYVGNLVDAIETCLTADLPSEATYLLSDGEAVSSPELVRRLAASLDVRARLLGIPIPLLKLAGMLAGRRSTIDRLVSSLRVDDSLIRSQLRWSPPFSLNDGLTHTASWYRRERAR